MKDGKVFGKINLIDLLVILVALAAVVAVGLKMTGHLGSVVTNHGWSDWATTSIPAQVKTMWYRFSRREDDYCIECSKDGERFTQMRVCHMWEGAGRIRFGVYACSPEDSSFTAVFDHM